MTVTVLILVLSGAAIYFSCEFFVNGIEWLGRKIGVGDTATGSVLAALGTALPESVVTFVALALADDATDVDVGIGAALGGPLALSTIGYATVGLALLLYAKNPRGPRPSKGEWRWLVRNQQWFLLVFALKIGLGVVAFPHKAVTGLLFIAAYAWFFVAELRNGAPDSHGELGPLKLQPHAKSPALAWVIVQTMASLAVVFVASRLFVDHLGAAAIGLGFAPGPVALFLSPVATELPEVMNAIIWVRQGKQRLALANISGAMMIQATVPTAMGLLFSPWMLGRAALFSAAATAAAVVMLLGLFIARRANGAALVQAAWLYVAFIAAMIWLD